MFQKIVYSFLFAVISMTNTFAQEINVKLKKGQVIIDGQHAYDYALFNRKKELYIYKKGTNEDVIILQRIGKRVAEEHHQFFFIYFEELKKSLETKEYITYPWPFILKKLQDEKVISSKGIIDYGAVQKFIAEYDEHLTRNLITTE